MDLIVISFNFLFFLQVFMDNHISFFLDKASGLADVPEVALSYLEEGLKDTEVNISFFGSTYISSSTQKGYASLEKTTCTVNKVFDSFRKSWNFSNETRNRIKVLENKIDAFYRNYDEKIKIMKAFTQFCNYLRESIFSALPFITRFLWVSTTRLSCYYTNQQWKNNFGFWDKPNKGLDIRANHYGCFVVYYHG